MPEPPATPKPRRKWLWRSLWALLFLLLSSVGFWCWSYYSALAERDALIAELRSRGEAVWWPEVAEELLAKPREGTGADLYLKAIWELGGETNPKPTKVPSKQLYDELDGVRFSPKSHPLVERELKLAEPALKLLEQSAKLPPGQVIRRLRNDEPISIILSEIQDMRRVARMLHWQSFDALAKSQPERAYKAVLLALEITEQFANEPFAIPHLVRLVVISEALDQLAMCLEFAPLPAAEFRAIDERLSKWEDGFGLQEPLKGERAMWMSTLEQPHVLWILTMDARRRATGRLESAIERGLLTVLSSKVGKPILTKAQTEFLGMFDYIANFIDDPSVDSDAISRVNASFSPRSILSRTIGTGVQTNYEWLSSLDRRCRKVHRKIVLARVALRLRRHFDVHGRFPDSLDAILDPAMPKIRLEWLLNKPLDYKPLPRGFELRVPPSVAAEEERTRDEAKRAFPVLDWNLELNTPPKIPGAAK
jgi:hypothetical protein